MIKPIYIYCKPEQKTKVQEIALKVSQSMNVPITVVTSMDELPNNITEVVEDTHDEETNKSIQQEVNPIKRGQLAAAIAHIQSQIEIPDIDTREFKIPDIPQDEYVVNTIHVQKEQRQKFIKDQQAKARRYINKHYKK